MCCTGQCSPTFHFLSNILHPSMVQVLSGKSWSNLTPHLSGWRIVLVSNSYGHCDLWCFPPNLRCVRSFVSGCFILLVHFNTRGIHLVRIVLGNTNNIKTAILWKWAVPRKNLQLHRHNTEFGDVCFISTTSLLKPHYSIMYYVESSECDLLLTSLQ